MRVRAQRSLLCCLVLSALVGFRTSRAQDVAGPIPGGDIAVYGNGEVVGRPNLIELDLQITGRAELTGDALVKYRDAKQRAVDALNDAKVDGVSTGEFGLTINSGSSAEQQLRAMQGQPAIATRPQVEVSSTLRVKLKDARDLAPEELIRSVGRLLDVAQDAGVGIGPNANELTLAMRTGRQLNSTSAVRFVITDLAQLREKAYEKAVADARDRATRLARLNNVKLGAVKHIQEMQATGDINIQQFQNPQQVVPVPDGEEPRLISATLSGTPVQVRLMVRFAIDGSGKTGE